MDKINIQLVGHFRISDDDGTDLTPVSEKAQAVVSLLATSKTLRRTRTWLQDKLWSNSDPARSSASLRQSLTTIRKALGPKADVLQANRLSVWLTEDLVEVDWQFDSGLPAGGAFLEGIDIADAEFNDWLQMMRSAGGPARAQTALPAESAVSPTKWRIALISGEDSVSTAFHLENEFVSLLVRSITEYGDIDVLFEAPDEPDCRTLDITVRAMALKDGDFGLRVAARRSLAGRVFWVETAVSSGATGPIEKSFDLLGLAFRLLTALGKEVSANGDDGTADELSGFLLGTVIPNVFSFRPQKLDHADKVLAQLHDKRPSATVLGWRAQIAVIRLIERFGGDTDDLVEMGKMLAAKAIEEDSTNSMALATAANANVLLDWDVSAGAELAGLAIRINPSNPFGWWAYANVALYSDDPDKALSAARVAARLAGKTSLQFWCEFQVGLAALRIGDLELATRALQTAAALSPHFRPPRRYLLALYVHRGDQDGAKRMVRQLKNLEPDFSLDTFLHDRAYPVSLARSAGLIEKASLADFVMAD